MYTLLGTSLFTRVAAALMPLLCGSSSDLPLEIYPLDSGCLLTGCPLLIVLLSSLTLNPTPHSLALLDLPTFLLRFSPLSARENARLCPPDTHWLRSSGFSKPAVPSPPQATRCSGKCRSLRQPRSFSWGGPSLSTSVLCPWGRSAPCLRSCWALSMWWDPCDH